MLIGSQSTSSLMDVFRIGMTEVIRATGLPNEAEFQTRGCSLLVKGKDLANRIDSLRIMFTPREGVTFEEMEAAINATRRRPHQSKTAWSKYVPPSRAPTAHALPLMILLKVGGIPCAPKHGTK